MGRGRIRVVLIGLAVAALLGVAGYVAAGTLVYDGLSKVQAACGTWTDAAGVSHPRFSTVTPADLAYYARSPLSAVTELAGRALAIVHGAADPATQPHHAQDLYAAATAAGVQVEAPWIVPYAGHTWEVLVARAEYEQRLAAFFGAHLSTGSSS